MFAFVAGCRTTVDPLALFVRNGALGQFGGAAAP